MQRRRFLFFGTPATAAASTATAAKPHRIKTITLAPIECRFHKFVAMNSYDTAPKGHTYTNWPVRVATGEGAEGIGVMGYAAPPTTLS